MSKSQSNTLIQGKSEMRLLFASDDLIYRFLLMMIIISGTIKSYINTIELNLLGDKIEPETYMEFSLVK